MGLQPDTRVILASGSPRRKELLSSIGIDFAVCVPDVDESLDPGWSPAEAVEQLAYRKGRAVVEALAPRRADSTAPGIAADSPFVFASAPSETAVLEAPLLVIAADTIVVLDGEVMGKPADAAHARRMLRRLSGREHEVYSGVAVFRPGGWSASGASGTGPAGRGNGPDPAVPLGDWCRFRVVSTMPSGEPEAVVGHTVSKVTFAPMTEEEIEAYVRTGEPLDKAGAYGIQGMGAVFVEKIEGDFYSVMGLPLHLLYQMLSTFGVRLFDAEKNTKNKR